MLTTCARMDLMALQYLKVFKHEINLQPLLSFALGIINECDCRGNVTSKIEWQFPSKNHTARLAAAVRHFSRT